MKKLIYIISITTITIIIVMCETEPLKSTNQDKFNHVATLPGGCNTKNASIINNRVVDNNEDTVIFSIENDTLNIFVGINYICCAPFVSGNNISNDSIILEIRDTCFISNHSCYCRCDCYYTWNFFFTGFKHKEYYYKILFFDPSVGIPTIFSEGIIDLNNY